MGLYGGDDKDKSIEKFNEELLNNKTTQQLGQLDELVTDLWKGALKEPRTLLDSVYKYTSGWPAATADKIVDDFWLGATDMLGGVLSGLGLPGGFAHPLQLQKIFSDDSTTDVELYNYRTPTDNQFTKCKENDGLSVWDTNGWWRCLFPESYVRTKISNPEVLGKILTKEKVQGDGQHNYGLFFKDYSGYLSWRCYMLQLAKERAPAKTSYSEDEKFRDIDATRTAGATTPESLLVWDRNRDAASDRQKTSANIIGTSSYTKINTTETGTEKITEHKTYYDDGTIALTANKKSIPADGSTPSVEKVHKVIDRKQDDDDSISSNDGWFWRK